MRVTLWLSFSAFLLGAALALTAPAVVQAAPFEFSPTAKAAFDKIAAAADSATAKQLNSSYAELRELQKQELKLDDKISGLHYKNKEDEIDLRKRIKEIDQGIIKAAEAEVAAAKARYAPLFALYESQKQQHALAKSLKNKQLTAYMKNQVDMTKAAVQLAKQDIQSRNAAVKKLKSEASDKMKQIRHILSANDTIQVKIKAAKSSVSTKRKELAVEAKLLTQTVRKSEAAPVLSCLARMIAYQRQIMIQKANIHYFEGQIEAVLRNAAAKLKSL